MESGYHSAQWFELDQVLRRVERLRGAVTELGLRLQLHGIEAVCGPQTGGAKLAEMIARELGLPFFHSERVETGQEGFFPVHYQLPMAQRDAVKGKRIAVVDDAISAGSAVRGTCHDVAEWGGRPVAIGALYLFGERAAQFAAERGLALEGIARVAFDLWPPAECPLCRAGAPLENVSDAV